MGFILIIEIENESNRSRMIVRKWKKTTLSRVLSEIENDPPRLRIRSKNESGPTTFRII